MQAKTGAAEERLTLIEQLLSRLRAPYPLGCLILALIMGLPGLLLIAFLDTGDTLTAVNRVLTPYSPRHAWTGILDLSVNTAIIFYMLLTIRFMRQRLVNSEPQLAKLTPGEENSLHKILGRISNAKGQLATTIALLIIIQLLPQSYQGSTQLGPTSPWSIILSLFIAALFYATVGTFVWAYISSLWSLHQFGKQPLRLESFQEDRLLGAGTIGSLSLTLAISYYTVFGPVAFESVILAPDLVGYATLLPLVAIGATMFFLPLTSIHKKMREEKQRAEKTLREQLSQLSTNEPVSISSQDSNVQEQINRLIKLQLVQMSEKRLQDVPTWPFDKRTLEILIAIFLSVLTALLSRLVFAALGL